MGDPFRKVQAGQPVELSATQWNAFVDAAKAHADSRHDRLRNPENQNRSSGIIRVRNDSGVALDRFAVVGLDGPIFDPADAEDAFLRGVLMSGVTPGPTHVGRFAVLLEPAPADQVVRAWASGVCQVRIDLVDPAHAYADITDGDSSLLTSGSSGSAEILWCQADQGYGYGYDTGEQWAIVRIGTTSSGTATATIRPARTGAYGIAAKYGAVPGSASCDSYEWDGVDLTATGSPITVKNPYSSAVGANKFIWVGFWSSAWWVMTEDCG